MMHSRMNRRMRRWNDWLGANLNASSLNAPTAMRKAKSDGMSCAPRNIRPGNTRLALVCLATWFMAQTKLDWSERHPRDPRLARELGVEELPPLSLANVRELLRAAMPLPQLNVDAATDLVIEHLVNRARSRKSRLNSLGYKHSLP